MNRRLVDFVARRALGVERSKGMHRVLNLALVQDTVLVHVDVVEYRLEQVGRPLLGPLIVINQSTARMVMPRARSS